MIKARGVIPALRRAGQKVLPRSRLRTLLNSLLLSFEKRHARTYEIGELRVRFALDATPSEDGPGSSAHERVSALQLEAFSRAVKPGDVVADVGAFRGEYTVVAAMRAGHNGHVVAFEPTLENLPYIEQNCRLNGVSNNVQIVPQAVSEQSGTVTFFAAGISNTNSMIAGVGEDGGLEQRIITATSLDEFFAGSLPPNVIKIDVEGAEWRVLRGAERIVRSDAIIFLELHPYAWENAGDDAEAMREWLRQRGRTLNDVASGEEITAWKYGPALLRKATS